jgi:hypothetical protein
MDGGFYSFDIDSDSSIVAVGYQTDTTNSFKDILFAKFTKDGLPIYNATWLRQGQKAYVRDVVSRNLNYFMTGISTAFSSGGEDFNTNHIDAQGFWKNGISNGDVKDDYPKSITIDTIGGLHFLVTGTTLGYGLAHSGILFIRYDSNLFCNTTPEITIPSSIKKSVDLDNLISVFPNPFTSYFLLRKSELLFDEHFTIEVFDINGVKIWSENWRKDQNELKINTTNWPASSYFIHIYNKQNNIGKVVFKLP